MSVLNQTNKFIELEKYNARMYKTGLDLYQENTAFISVKSILRN